MALNIPMVERPKDYNALTKEMLENRMAELKNQYYGPNIESEIGLRNSQSKEINQLLPGRVTELNQKNQMYIPKTRAEIAQSNALTNRYNIMTPLEALELKIKNQYYGPKTRAEIAQSNALTNKYNTMTPLEALELNQKNQMYIPKTRAEIAQSDALTNKYNTMTPLEALELNQKNQMYIPKTRAEIAQSDALTNKYNTMTPLEALELKIKNQYAGQRESADIEEKKAQAYLNMHGGSNASVAHKDLNDFSQQLMLDNPKLPNEDQNKYNQRINQMQSAYLAEETKLPNGSYLPPLSGTANQILTTVTGRNAPVAVKNQAANLDVLVNDLNDFDINAIKSFAGPEGKAKLTYAKLKMATNPDDPTIDPTARRYLSAMNQAIINMDSMRKAFGTSVVPDYVYQTVGRLTNPSDSIFNDATQVGINFRNLIKTMEKNRDFMFAKVKRGVTAQPVTQRNRELREGGPDNNENEGKESRPGHIWMQDSKGAKYEIAIKYKDLAKKGISPSGEKVPPLTEVG